MTTEVVPSRVRRGFGDPETLVERVRAGDRRAVARCLSLVEDGEPAQLRAVAERLAPHAGSAAIVGVTGSPGVGKSTVCDTLIGAWRAAGRTVGVLAVDPSSPLTGGALLGDRVRMQRHALDDGVFIRSMASRGHLGGLAWATAQAVRVLAAAGCEVVVVETVGAGQAEVEVAGLADTTLVVLAPGFGDAVQVAKAGILEIADVFVVNKTDAPGAHDLARDLKQMLHLGERRPWDVPVVRTTAHRPDAADSGIAELVDAIDAHQRHIDGSGQRERHRAVAAAHEIEALVLAALRERLGAPGRHGRLGELAGAVAAGTVGPYAAADTILADMQVPPTPATDDSKR
jgi:LAO/AO transport system kinase